MNRLERVIYRRPNLRTVTPKKNVDLDFDAPSISAVFRTVMEWDSTDRNGGHVFSSGIVIGGAAGMQEGLAKAPNRRMRVLTNSIMNHAGKRGSLYGNTLAVLGEIVLFCFGLNHHRPFLEKEQDEGVRRLVIQTSPSGRHYDVWSRSGLKYRSTVLACMSAALGCSPPTFFNHRLAALAQLP